MVCPSAYKVFFTRAAEAYSRRHRSRLVDRQVPVINEVICIGDHMSNLTNKVALVTGGSRGIGAAIAKRLAADGAIVAITYVKDASAASALVKAIELDGGKALAIQADAADVEAVKSAVEKTVAGERRSCRGDRGER